MILPFCFICFFGLIFAVFNLSSTASNELKTELTGTTLNNKMMNSERNTEKECDRDIQYFQVYHISKCGGSNMRRVLGSVFNMQLPDHDPLSHRYWFEDHGFWKRERENRPDPRYKGDPNSVEKRKTFILGLVRNPFGYYRSFYSMITADHYLSEFEKCKDFILSNGNHSYIKQCPCEIKCLFHFGKKHLLLNVKLNNISAFHEWLEFTIQNKKCLCKQTMTQRHDQLMLMNDGSIAYDAVVKQEDYYPMTRKALQQFNRCVPNITNFSRFDEIQIKDKHRNARDSFMSKAQRKTKVLPDLCYYSPLLRHLVETHDAEMMKRYNYTWQSFVGNASYKRDCQDILE